MEIQSKFKHITRLLRENNVNNSAHTTKDTTNTNIISEINSNINNKNANDLNKNKSDKNESQNKTIRDKVNTKRVFIDNIQFDVHENLLERLLSKYGKIKRTKIIRDQLTKKSKGMGYVEFFEASDVENLLKTATPVDLMLKERQMNIQPYLEKKTRPQRKKVFIDMEQNNQMDVDVSDDMETNASTSITNINDLPIDILTNIMSHLCLRDLCIAEQVCKKWYNVAYVVWSVKKKLILDEKHIFENYVGKVRSRYGFVFKPKFDPKALSQILKKSTGKSLNYIDLSSSSTSLGPLSLLYISYHCSNLTHLNISKIDISNQGFKYIRDLKYLKELKMAYCSQISDSALAKMFNNCKNLETIDLTFCHTLTGQCFLKTGGNLKSITIDQCENISDESLMCLFSQNKQLEYISIRRANSIKPATLLYLFNVLKILKELNLADHGFSCLLNCYIDNINFDRLENLTKLNLSNSKASNELIARLLNTSRSLKSLNLNNCTGLNDNLFYGLSINSPLEELDISFVQTLTDVTLDSLIQLSNSLKKLLIKGDSRFTNEKIIKLMSILSNLTVLDVTLIPSVNNTLLEAALRLDKRKIKIYCNDTSINTIEFKYKNPDISETLIDRNLYLFKYRNITFEISGSKLDGSKRDKADWNRDFIYIGSALSGSDDSSYEFNDFSDADQVDDDLDFLEEKQEMFDELDQY